MLGISIATGGIDPDTSALKYLKYSPSIENLRNETHGSVVYALSPKHVGIHFHNTKRVFVAEPLHPSIQELRDEVRMMVAEGRPNAKVPMYRGKSIDGNPVLFLQTWYSKYLLGNGSNTLFLHDLRLIDNALARAVEVDKLRTPALIGTKSDMFAAMAEGKFVDGADTRRRLRNAIRNKKTRKS